MTLADTKQGIISLAVAERIRNIQSPLQAGWLVTVIVPGEAPRGPWYRDIKDAFSYIQECSANGWAVEVTCIQEVD